MAHYNGEAVDVILEFCNPSNDNTVFMHLCNIIESDYPLEIKYSAIKMIETLLFNYSSSKKLNISLSYLLSVFKKVLKSLTLITSYATVLLLSNILGSGYKQFIFIDYEIIIDILTHITSKYSDYMSEPPYEYINKLRPNDIPNCKEYLQETIISCYISLSQVNEEWYIELSDKYFKFKDIAHNILNIDNSKYIIIMKNEVETMKLCCSNYIGFLKNFFEFYLKLNHEIQFYAVNYLRSAYKSLRYVFLDDFILTIVMPHVTELFCTKQGIQFISNIWPKCKIEIFQRLIEKIDEIINTPLLNNNSWLHYIMTLLYYLFVNLCKKNRTKHILYLFKYFLKLFQNSESPIIHYHLLNFFQYIGSDYDNHFVLSGRFDDSSDYEKYVLYDSQCCTSLCKEYIFFDIPPLIQSLCIYLEKEKTIQLSIFAIETLLKLIQYDIFWKNYCLSDIIKILIKIIQNPSGYYSVSSETFINPKPDTRKSFESDDIESCYFSNEDNSEENTYLANEIEISELTDKCYILLSHFTQYLNQIPSQDADNIFKCLCEGLEKILGKISHITETITLDNEMLIVSRKRSISSSLRTRFSSLSDKNSRTDFSPELSFDAQTLLQNILHSLIVFVSRNSVHNNIFKYVKSIPTSIAQMNMTQDEYPLPLILMLLVDCAEVTVNSISKCLNNCENDLFIRVYEEWLKPITDIAIVVFDLDKSSATVDFFLLVTVKLFVEWLIISPKSLQSKYSQIIYPYLIKRENKFSCNLCRLTIEHINEMFSPYTLYRNPPAVDKDLFQEDISTSNYIYKDMLITISHGLLNIMCITVRKVLGVSQWIIELDNLTRYSKCIPFLDVNTTDIPPKHHPCPYFQSLQMDINNPISKYRIMNDSDSQSDTTQSDMSTTSTPILEPKQPSPIATQPIIFPKNELTTITELNYSCKTERESYDSNYKSGNLRSPTNSFSQFDNRRTPTGSLNNFKEISFNRLRGSSDSSDSLIITPNDTQRDNELSLDNSLEDKSSSSSHKQHILSSSYETGVNEHDDQLDNENEKKKVRSVFTNYYSIFIFYFRTSS